ncbi:MAG: hypothetical protein ACKO2C_03410 [Actinomycetes bacterium]
MIAALVLVALPAGLILAAWIAARVSVRGSRLEVTADGVLIANHRRPSITVPLDEVDAFEPTPRIGFLGGIRPPTCVLVRRDGTRVPVRRVDAPGAGVGVGALNARIAELRRSPEIG